MYWRSKLYLEDHSILMQIEKWPKDNNTLLFFDVTFEFIHGKSISASFSAFFLSHHSGIYTKTIPISLQVLQDHAKTASLDLMSGPPKAMSGMMGKALKDFQGNNEGRELIKIDNDNNKLILSLYYPQLQDIGLLYLEVQESSSKLDSLGITPLYRALTSSKNDERIENTVTQEHELVAVFEEWQTYQPTLTVEKDNTIQMGSTSDTASNNPSSRPPQVYQYRDMRRKKRKKGPMYKQM